MTPTPSPSRPAGGAEPDAGARSTTSAATGPAPAARPLPPQPPTAEADNTALPPGAQPDTVDVDELQVLPADHLRSGAGLVLDAGEAPAAAVRAPDAGAPPKRRRGRPPGQRMQLLAASLRHHHFSFLRAQVEGVRDLRWAWEQYLGFEGGPDDERHFHLRLRELVKLVSFAAGERGLADRALKAFSGLDLRPPAAATRSASEPAPTGEGAEAAPAAPPPPPVKPLPSLDEWIEEKCAEWGVDFDFQRQSEWLEQYEEEFGLNQPPPAQSATAGMDLPDAGEAPSPAPANSGAPAGDAPAAPSAGSDGPPVPIGTLEERIGHLKVLDLELSKPPSLEDTLASWLAPEMARRLAGAAIKGKAMPLVTLANLIDFVNLFGHRWWVHVPRLGEERAKRLVNWLVPQAEALGRPIKEASRVPYAQRLQAQQVAHETALARLGADANRRFGVVPLDRLAVPPEIDGRTGTFRSAAPNTLGVENDLDAIYAWLRRPGEEKVRTNKQYGRMLERFYLWCLWIKKKPIGDLVEGDFHDYKAFLKNPPADWVNAMPVARSSPDWRPLRSPQNENSLRQNFTVINAFLNAMHKAGYLTAQAAEGVMPSLKLKQLRVNIDRTFDDAQWAWVMGCLAARYEAAQKSHAAAQDAEAALAAKEGRPPKRMSPLRLALLRRQRLVLELGATTGLRLIELVTTRLGQISRVDVDGESVWLAKVVGKGEKDREVLIYDDVMDLIRQHHADMDEAGTSFAPSSKRVRTINNPDAEPPPKAGPAATSALNPDYAPEPGSGLIQVPSPALSLQPAGPEQLDERMRPLVGALRSGFSPALARAKAKDEGAKSGEAEEVLNAERYGSLDPNGLRQALKRFLAACADEAERTGAGIDAERLRLASTHWLRHFFANSAASDGVSPVALMESMGHASLSTTSVYLRQERKRLVSEMGKMRRRTAD